MLSKSRGWFRACFVAKNVKPVVHDGHGGQAVLLPQTRQRNSFGTVQAGPQVATSNLAGFEGDGG